MPGSTALFGDANIIYTHQLSLVYSGNSSISGDAVPEATQTIGLQLLNLRTKQSEILTLATGKISLGASQKIVRRERQALFKQAQEAYFNALTQFKACE